MLSLRKRRRGQRIVVQAQCEKCREGVGDQVDAREYDAAELAKFPVWLPKRASGPRTKRRREYKKNRSSARMAKLKNEVMARDNWTCRECGEPATDLSHRHYKNFGHETAADFLASCSTCNQAERQRRIAGGRS